MLTRMNAEKKSIGSNFEELLPIRHPQKDIFLCDVADAVIKDIMQEMEHPFYSLSKKPETTTRRYEHGKYWIEISPNEAGLATIYDKDILIYCISQIMAKLNRGESVQKQVRMPAREFLIFTNRGTSGRDYLALAQGLKRLRGTTISTNIRTGGEEEFRVFGLIDEASIRRKLGSDGRMLWVDITLSDWVFNAIREKEVLTLHEDYFRLRKPLERRVYEIARKYCGKDKKKKMSLDILLTKTGSKSLMKKFRFNMNEMEKTNHLPDYKISIEGEDVIFINRGTMLAKKKVPFSGALPIEAYEAGRKAAPGWDIYQIEQEWRNWVADGKMDVKNPARHFEKFCASWFKKRGKP